jgi:hypothetical protein
MASAAGQAAGLTAVSAEVRRRKLDELWRRRQEQAQKLRAVVAAAAPARDGGRRSQMRPSAGRDGSGTASGEPKPDAAKAATDAAAAQGIAPDDEAELERRLGELEEELQSLLDIAGGTEGEGSR